MSTWTFPRLRLGLYAPQAARLQDSHQAGLQGRLVGLRARIPLGASPLDGFDTRALRTQEEPALPANGPIKLHATTREMTNMALWREATRAAIAMR